MVRAEVGIQLPGNSSNLHVQALPTSKGISAGAITKESSFDTKQKARAGKYQLLFFSPESLLSGGHWRETLSQTEPFRSHVVLLGNTVSHAELATGILLHTTACYSYTYTG